MLQIVLVMWNERRVSNQHKDASQEVADTSQGSERAIPSGLSFEEVMNNKTLPVYLVAF